MATQQTYDRYMSDDPSSIASIIGVQAARSALHLSFPNDFEYYMMALELTDYEGRTIDYFVFPVNPDMYRQDEPSVTTIRKTMGGVSAVGNSSFVPIPIRINGNFGRKFRLMIGKDSDTPDFGVANYSTLSGVVNKEGFINGIGGKFKKATINSRVKTGYGATKILQAICDKSKADIDGKPNRLYFYNPAFGVNYLVKLVNFSPIQSHDSSNMIWNYELSLTAIALLESVVGSSKLRTSLTGSLGRDIVQRNASKIVRLIKSL